MASRNGRTNWAVIIAGGALGLTLIMNVLGYAGRDTERLDKRLTQVENDLTWKYVTKEYISRDLVFLNRILDELKKEKLDTDVYDQKIPSIERQIVLLRERQQELDRSVNQAFNARDAFASIQQRMLEIERQARTTKPSP